jgi:molybdopterin converting factor small subunit
LEVYLHLYSILREKLPSEAKGKVTLQLKDGATIETILKEFGITRRVVIGVNGEHEADKSRQLRDGDHVKIFSSISGGADEACRRGMQTTTRSIHIFGRENDETWL